MKPISLAPFAVFYFGYFAFQGLFGPFWGLYLESLSFSALQISVLISLSTLARVVAPGFWGWLADRRGQRRLIVIVTSVLSAAFFLPLGLGQSFWWVFACLALSHFFWAAALPLVEASTAELTRDSPGRYSRVRVWGSLGFVVLSVVGGYLLEWLPLSSLPWVLTALLAVVAVMALYTPELPFEEREQGPGSIWGTLGRGEVRALFACCFLMAFAMGPYYVFYSIALKDVGYSRDATGWLWAVGVMSEILIFVAMPRIMGRFTLERLMLVSLGAGVVRFALVATVLSQPLLAFVSQTLHALTFGLHHAVSVALIHRYFARAHQARGQGLYVIASFGAGGSLGGLLGGVLWGLGGATLTFAVSALVSALGMMVCQRWLRSSGERP